MTTPYTPVPAAAGNSITTPDDSDSPSGALFGVPYQQCADLAACALADVQTFTGSGTWTKPTLATMLHIQLIGKGGAGGAGFTGSPGGGGGGGTSGEYLEAWVHGSDIPATLTIAFTSGTPRVHDGANFDLTVSAGTAGGDGLGASGYEGGLGGSSLLEIAYTLSRAAISAGMRSGDQSTGGTGGSSSSGSSTGNPGVYGGQGLPGVSAAGGAQGKGGSGGLGYGAGGGGGAGASGGGGGGGGGGGLGVSVAASAGGNAAGTVAGAGGAAAAGVVVITTWRKP